MFEKQQTDKEKLDLKLQRVKELAKILQLHAGQSLTTRQRMENENLKIKMEFRLNTLVMDSKLKEADIKIDIYEQMNKILNNKA